MEKITPAERATTTATEDIDQKGLHNRQKEAVVQSVALANAVAKDSPNYGSATQMRLYAMMALCVMSKLLSSSRVLLPNRRLMQCACVQMAS